MSPFPAAPVAVGAAGEQWLRAERLSKVYRGGRVALRRASTDFTPGVTVLVGPNGAGKTTLLRLLAGILAPTEGSLHWCGLPVARSPVAYRDVVGYLSQEFSPYEEMSPRRFLAYLSALKGIPDRLWGSRVDELLELVDIRRPKLDRPCRELSHGERRRLGLAQALLNDPFVLVLDEPSAGLDPEARVKLLHRVRELAAGKVVVLSSHTLADVGQVADRVILLESGTIQAVETRDDFLTSARGYVLEGEVTTAELARLSAGIASRVVARSPLGAGRFRVRLVTLEPGHAPLDAAEGPGVGGRWRPVEPGFEDAYVLRRLFPPGSLTSRSSSQGNSGGSGVPD